jgi:hypothetical protein
MIASSAIVSFTTRVAERILFVLFLAVADLVDRRVDHRAPAGGRERRERVAHGAMLSGLSGVDAEGVGSGLEPSSW